MKYFPILSVGAAGKPHLRQKEVEIESVLLKLLQRLCLKASKDKKKRRNKKFPFQFDNILGFFWVRSNLLNCVFCSKLYLVARRFTSWITLSDPEPVPHNEKR